MNWPDNQYWVNGMIPQNEELLIAGMAEPVLRTGSVVPNSEPVPKLEPWFPKNGTGSTYFPIFIDFITMSLWFYAKNNFQIAPQNGLKHEGLY